MQFKPGKINAIIFCLMVFLKITWHPRHDLTLTNHNYNSGSFAKAC